MSATGTARRHVDIAALSDAKVIALVGVSETGFYGRQFVKNLREGGFTGEIVPIHRSATTVAGLPAYPSVADVPHRIDVGVLIVRASNCPAIAAEFAEKGARCLVVLSDGFAETATEEGREIQRQLVDVCDEAGMLLIGPNGVGAADVTAGVVCLGVPLNEPMAIGGTSIVSQSGAILSGLLEGFTAEGVGADLAISVGNGAQFSIADAIDTATDRDTTHIIAGYIESFGPDLPRIRASLLRAREREKTVVFVKSGRTELSQAVAVSHTASISGPDELISAMLEGCGVHRVDESEELIRLVKLASMDRVQAGARSGGGVAVVTASGGNAGILADLASEHGLHLADFSPATWAALHDEVPASGFVGNPLDVTGGSAAGAFDLEVIYENLFGDPAVGVLLYGFAPPWPTDEPGREAHRRHFEVIAAAAERHGKAAIIPTTALQRSTPWVTEFARANPHVIFPLGQTLTVRALAYLFPAPPPRASTDPLTAGGSHAPSSSLEVLSEGRGRELLGAAGLPVAAGVHVPDETWEAGADAVRDAIAGLHAPYVLKANMDGVSHKAAIGGVRLRLHDADALIDAAAGIRRDVAAAAPHVVVDGLLVEEMVSGTELLLGMVRHDDVGPMLTLGLGGSLSETTDLKATVPMWPEADDWVPALLHRAGLAAIVDRIPGALEALDETLSRAREAFLSGPLRDCHTVEINPLFLGPDRFVAAGDALILTTNVEGR